MLALSLHDVVKHGLERAVHRSKHSPPNLVARAHRDFLRLPFEPDPTQAIQDLSKVLEELKGILHGEDEKAAQAVVLEACKAGLPKLMVYALENLEYEARMDAAEVFGAIVRTEVGREYPGLRHVLQNPGIVVQALIGYHNPDLALQSGAILRHCIWHEQVASLVLESHKMMREVFDLLDLTNFEFASDAFLTFRDLLTRHKTLVRDYMLEHFIWVFDRFTVLITSENYVMQWQSLKLLGELLNDPANEEVAAAYTRHMGNLRVVMELLTSRSRNIQYEAFQVFKVFVSARPKAQAVLQVLVLNRDGLISYLGDFHRELDDEGFQHDRAAVMKQISALQLSEA